MSTCRESKTCFKLDELKKLVELGVMGKVPYMIQLDLPKKVINSPKSSEQSAFDKWMKKNQNIMSDLSDWEGICKKLPGLSIA